MVQAIGPQAVVTIVTALSSPSVDLDRPGILAAAGDLGWAVRSERPTGITFTSTLPLRSQRVKALFGPKDMVEVTLALTDPIEEDDSTARAELDTRKREFVAALVAEVGSYSGKKSTPRSTFWDFADGRRVTVSDLVDRLHLKISNHALAQLERDEVRLGIDPNRDPFAPADDL